MSSRAFPENTTDFSHDVRNALILAGFNPSVVTKDRPLPPDGLKLMAELWRNGASVDLIMEELNLSEARASGDLLFLELKGEIEGFVECLLDVSLYQTQQKPSGRVGIKK